jgi:hypothetical protein
MTSCLGRSTRWPHQRSKRVHRGRIQVPRAESVTVAPPEVALLGFPSSLEPNFGLHLYHAHLVQDDAEEPGGLGGLGLELCGPRDTAAPLKFEVFVGSRYGQHTNDATLSGSFLTTCSLDMALLLALVTSPKTTVANALLPDALDVDSEYPFSTLQHTAHEQGASAAVPTWCVCTTVKLSSRLRGSESSHLPCAAVRW